MAVSPWLDNSPIIPVEHLTQDELLDTWGRNRNNTYGVMAAEEVMKRLTAQRKENSNA